MRKNLLLYFGMACLAALTLAGCKKDDQQKTNTAISPGPALATESSSDYSFSVSQYGFLVFPTMEDFDGFRMHLMNGTHEEAQAELASLGVSSLGAINYDGYGSEIVSEEQTIDYALNADYVVQVENIVMRALQESSEEVRWEFVLTLTADNLTATTHEYLISGIFDPNSMNKFATNPDEEFALLEFIKETPAGYEDTQSFETQAKRPGFGSVTTCTDIQGGCWDPGIADYRPCSHVNTKKYFFWILVSDGNGKDDGWKYGSCDFNGY